MSQPQDLSQAEFAKCVFCKKLFRRQKAPSRTVFTVLRHWRLEFKNDQCVLIADKSCLQRLINDGELNLQDYKSKDRNKLFDRFAIWVDVNGNELPDVIAEDLAQGFGRLPSSVKKVELSKPPKTLVYRQMGVSVSGMYRTKDSRMKFGLPPAVNNDNVKNSKRILTDNNGVVTDQTIGIDPHARGLSLSSSPIHDLSSDNKEKAAIHQDSSGNDILPPFPRLSETERVERVSLLNKAEKEKMTLNQERILFRKQKQETEDIERQKRDIEARSKRIEELKLEKKKLEEEEAKKKAELLKNKLKKEVGQKKLQKATKQKDKSKVIKPPKNEKKSVRQKLKAIETEDMNDSEREAIKYKNAELLLRNLDTLRNTPKLELYSRLVDMGAIVKISNGQVTHQDIMAGLSKFFWVVMNEIVQYKDQIEANSDISERQIHESLTNLVLNSDYFVNF